MRQATEWGILAQTFTKEPVLVPVELPSFMLRVLLTPVVTGMADRNCALYTRDQMEINPTRYTTQIVLPRTDFTVIDPGMSFAICEGCNRIANQ